jgi:hypothetical protein
MSTRSISSGVFGSLATALATKPVFSLPDSLATLAGVSFTEPTTIVTQTRTRYGYTVECSDGRTRQLNLNTVMKFRGEEASKKAAQFFSTDRVGESFRFVAVGGWSCNEWFAAVLRA